MGRFLVLAAVLCVCLGCKSEPNQVHFILPIGFRGAFAVKPDDSLGIILVNKDGRYVVRIPESGLLCVKGLDPFHPYVCTAAFANGSEIWVSKRLDDKPRKEQNALWDGATQSWDENGRPVNFFWWFVGTEDEWNASDEVTRYRLGGVPKKSGD